MGLGKGLSAVQATRARVVRAYEAGKDDDEDERAQRQRLFDATLLTWLTTVPPDRVGVTRQLQLGVTLKPTARPAAAASIVRHEN